MTPETEFGLLGPLTVRRDGTTVPVPAGRQRALLAALLLRAGQVVPASELIDVLWEDAPPPTARAGLHNYVRRLRQTLADGQHERIVTHPQGYLVRVRPGELDVTRFESLLTVARAAAAAGRWADAAGRARAALALWRGEPLADAGSPVLAAREVPRLAELRLQALDVAIDAGLRCGQHAGLAGELRGLVASHPLRERLHAQLMLALYRDGQAAEALAAYAAARQVLAEELGTDPGPALRELHQRILTGDPGLALDAPPAGPAPAARVTWTLPRDVSGFTGRDSELGRITATVAEGQAVVGIQAIGGMAGVGKTALAVHAAHRLAGQFPDAQLFVPLHGHTPGRRPAEPADALAGLLATAGYTAAQIPPGLPERTGLWRDHLAGQRVLLVLDDAVSSEQVEPLLPTAGGSLVLVTSRRNLTALDGARVLHLDVLPPGTAAELLVRLADRPGLAVTDEAVARLCALSGYLPLAIGMLARQLHYHPSWTPAGLASELAAARDRLELMGTGDTSVAAAFELSYAGLSPDQQWMFRCLGSHPGSDLDAYAAAALGGVPLAAARRRLQELYDHCLLTEPAPGRYRQHDLLRQYAGMLAQREDGDGERDQVRSRLAGYYLHTAARADTYLARQPHAGPATTPGPAPAAGPELPDGVQALRWARAERPSLLACLAQATDAGRHDLVVAFTAALNSVLRRDGPWAEATGLHRAAVTAARLAGDQAGEAGALVSLGAACQLTGDRQGAVAALTEALALYRALGNRLGEANALLNLGVVNRLTVGLASAIGLLREALGHYRALDSGLGQAIALFELASVHRLSGDRDEAISEFQAARALFREAGNRAGEAGSVNGLGGVYWLTGDYQRAAAVLAEALALSREHGEPLGQGNALLNLGAVLRLTGNYQRSAESHRAALDIFRALGNQTGQANALLDLGALRRLAGDYPGAVALLHSALDIYRHTGDRLGQANTLLNLGVVSRLTGDHAEADRTLRTALDIHRGVGDRMGEAEVQNELGALAHDQQDLNQAEARYGAALDLARQISDVYAEAHARAGLGRCALAAGRHAAGVASLREAHQLFHRSGAAEAAGLAAELRAASTGPALTAP